jgi:hypothetical protein
MCAKQVGQWRLCALDHHTLLGRLWRGAPARNRGEGRADPNRYGKILFDDHSWVLKEVEGARRALRRYAKLYDLELTDFFKRLGGRGTTYPRDLNLSGGIQSPVFTLYDPNFQDDLGY